jgi:timeless
LNSLLIVSYRFETVIAQKIKLRENALAQCNTLLELKRSICHHPSHYNNSQGGGLLSIFVSLLAEPLSHAGNSSTSRTDADHLTIELVLHLFRNLLSIDALVVDPSHRSQHLHNDLIVLLEQEMVLEILLVLAADLEARENRPYNLMVMELVHHLLKHHDPTAVARASLANSSSSTQEATKIQPGRLKEGLLREKLSLAPNTLTRHSHFGGSLVVEKHGRKQVISAARVGEKRKTAPALAKKRKNKKSEPFVGAATQVVDEGGPAQERAMKTIAAFCERFVRDCYGPFAKSLKNELIRDSVRLEDDDRVVFFRIVWFFCQWWRVSGKNKLMPTERSGGNQDAAMSALGQLVFTADRYTFNILWSATDTYQERKQYKQLAQAVATLSELLHLVHVMNNSNEETERLMAIGLMSHLFYEKEPLDRLPKLLSRWVPGTSTRLYLGDVAEVAHITLKLLDESSKWSQGASKLKGDQHDTVEKLKAQAAEFDVGFYFRRKILSNQTVYMYTQLLSCYATNTPHVNHRVVAFFLRLCKCQVHSAEAAYDEANFLLRHKTVSLEQMLHNIQLFVVLDKILNDASIRHRTELSFLISFATVVMHNFARATSANPVLFVEALLSHPHPHKFCEFAGNMYVTDELRQIAERDLYLEEGKNLEQQEKEVRRQADDSSDSSDEELELEDFGVVGASSLSLHKKKQRPKDKKVIAKRSSASDSESSDDELFGSSKPEADDPPRKSGVAAAGNRLDDESDSDDASAVSKPGMHVAKKQKRIHQDNDSDKESSDYDSHGKESNRRAKYADLKKNIEANNDSDADSRDEEGTPQLTSRVDSGDDDDADDVQGDGGRDS